MTTQSFYDLSLVELTSILESWGEPSYRAHQIWQGLYRHCWNDPAQFTQLSLALRTKLSENFHFDNLTPAAIMQSSDKMTVKTLFTLPDGLAIEAVLMKYEKRQTLCISTQAGCAMGCVFCATGQMGFKRHLTSGEIVSQVMYYARQLNEKGQAVTNVVLMGMGEPFHNYDNTMAAIDRLNDSEGYNFGARRFTISTVGLVPAIRRFAAENRQVNLSISLHAADDVLRASMLPVDKRYPIDELLEACREYIDQTGRRLTFEWALVNGVNDTPEQAHLLAEKVKGILCHVN